MMYPEPHQQLLVIDQAPLLRAAVDECQQACQAIERLRVELRQHETRDRPAYERWRDSSFLSHLAQVRRAARQSRAREFAPDQDPCYR